MNKKKTLIYLSATLLFFASCKKDESASESETSTFKNKGNGKLANVPGAGQGMDITQTGPNQYYSSLGGGVTFNAITYYSGPYQNGEAALEIFGASPQEPGAQVLTVGPYIVLTRFLNGTPANFSTGYSNFSQAYSDFFTKAIDPLTGSPKQAQRPKLNDYLPESYSEGGPNQVVYKGIVVRSKNSPTTLTIVDASTNVTPYLSQMYELFPDLVRNGVRYDITGNAKGTAVGPIMGVTAVELSTNKNVPIYGFTGTYHKDSTGTIIINNLRIYLTSEDFFDYQGSL
ncbi:hypothetical protein [Pedobacter roseus]|uniref:Uncharacterized protein n=1 Tax=Pedobacter roseus TaxID=336820 RepID=A0A7G9QMW7_9SPHI|nr:hypothetical protein [Pedobacter roseus]QNN44692.1 hypothetical protein H9L23_11710 [Pedobacter roseus]